LSLFFVIPSGAEAATQPTIVGEARLSISTLEWRRIARDVSALLDTTEDPKPGTREAVIDRGYKVATLPVAGNLFAG